MKKLKLQSLLVLCIAAIASSCSKDDDNNNYIVPVANQKEDPFQSYLTDSGFTTSTEIINAASFYEFGYKFRPIAAGSITALTVKIPDVNTSLRVTIWDVATSTALKTEILNVASSGTAVTKDITALELTKDKEYMVTMNSNDWYRHAKADATAASYPITEGNLQITGYGFAYGSAQTFPDSFVDNYDAGDVSVTFLKK